MEDRNNYPITKEWRSQQLLKLDGNNIAITTKQDLQHNHTKQNQNRSGKENQRATVWIQIKQIEETSHSMFNIVFIDLNNE